jgi:organic radical activating enzyme
MTNSDDPDKGVMRRVDKSIYNARDNDFLESINCQKVKDLRKDLMSGVQNPLCKTCWEKEEIGLKSKRIVTNRIFSDEVNIVNAKTITDDDGHLNDYQLGYLDLRFGNNCNLKCIMCHPSSSSKWYSDYVKLFNTKHFYDTGDKVPLKEIDGKWHLQQQDYFKWYENEQFWQTLKENIKNTKQIYLVGGEPLLIQEHFNFLKYCVEENIATNITLEYDTNLTILNNEIISLWSHFKKVKARVSIESTKEQNDYIRYPSKWCDIEANIDQLNNHNKNIELDLSITWQIYNLFSITQIFDKYPELGSIRTLSQPSYLDIKILPRKYKEKAIEHLTPYLNSCDKVRKQVHSMLEYLNKHINYCSDEQLARFKKYTSDCDKLRNTNFKSIFPELADLIN